MGLRAYPHIVGRSATLRAGAWSGSLSPPWRNDGMSDIKQWPGKIREHPRMSAPKLGEYLDVKNAHRRERIIHDQKFPANFIVARYSDAENAARGALLRGDDVHAYLAHTAKALSARTSVNKHRDDSRRNCVEAIGAFGLMWESLALHGVERLAAAGQFMILVDGVELTARPTVLLRCALPNGRVEHGALQLVFRKDAALDKHGGQAAALVLRRALLRAGHDVASKLCIIADVFAGQYYVAPTTSKRLTDEIGAACREIAVRWPAILARKSG